MQQDMLYREPVIHRSGELPLKIYKTHHVTYHWHDEYEFLLSDEDDVHCTVSGQQIILNRGDTLIIQGGRLHSLSMSMGRSITAIVVHPRLWSGDLACRPLDGLEFTSLFTHGSTLGEKIHGILNRVKNCYDARLPCCEFLLRSHFCSLFALLLEEGEYRESTADQRGLSSGEAALFDYVHRHLGDALSLDTLCARSHYSKSYVIRLFKKNTGQTPTEYINSCRIELAKELLKTKSVTETALECGFNNLSYFCKVFRRCTGETPRRWNREPLAFTNCR